MLILDLAQRYMYDGDLERAIEYHLTFIEKAPDADKPLAYHNLACCFNNQENPDLAEMYFRMAIGERPNSSAYVEYGNFLYQAKKIDKATAVLKKALEFKDEEVGYTASEINTVTLALQKGINQFKEIILSAHALSAYLLIKCNPDLLHEYIHRVEKEASAYSPIYYLLLIDLYETASPAEAEEYRKKLETIDSEDNQLDIALKPKTSTTHAMTLTSAPRLKAKLPNNETVFEFEEHAVHPDGDCGFTALGVERSTVATYLLSLINDNESREFLADEICDAFLTHSATEKIEGLAPLDSQIWQQLLERQNSAQNNLDVKFRQMRDQEGAATERLTLDQFINWLQDNDKPLDAQLLVQERLTVFQAEDALKIYCKQKNVFEYYINKLGTTKLWLGYKSGLLYAKQMQMNLYIWRKEENDAGRLVLMDFYETTNPMQEIHMLHTAGFTHFNFLSKSNDIISQMNSIVPHQLPEETKPQVTVALDETEATATESKIVYWWYLSTSQAPEAVQKETQEEINHYLELIHKKKNFKKQ